MRIAINGMGRIGKNFLRVLFSDPNVLQKITPVALNIGPAHKEFVAHQFTYDSLMGTFQGEVSLKDDIVIINGYKIKVFSELDPSSLPWKSLKIDWVVDCSGKFTHRKQAQKHCESGAGKVLVSAPMPDDDVTIIPGVNDSAFDEQKHTIVSLGSCTTNAVVPMLKVLHDAFEIQHAFMTTVHAYTNSQVLLDCGTDHDQRRGRAAAINCIPTSTGASKTVEKVLPNLAGRFTGAALRVPLDKVSLIDLAVICKTLVVKEKINTAFDDAAKTNSLKGILTCTREPLVSSDFKGNNSSVIIDQSLTAVQGSLIKVFGWYDNEWGYSQRLKDFLMKI